VSSALCSAPTTGAVEFASAASPALPRRGHICCCQVWEVEAEELRIVVGVLLRAARGGMSKRLESAPWRLEQR
jgi:hypothetical protein